LITSTSSPRSSPPSSAAARFSTISSAASGARPSLMEKAFSDSSSTQLSNAVADCEPPIGSPSASRMRLTLKDPSVVTRPTAAATPSTPATSSTRASGRLARWSPVSRSENRMSPCTTASTSSTTSLNRSSKDWSSVVDRMNVPAMNATPSTTASTVDRSRRLCAQSERSVTLRIRA
jgi:hypothetical protein